MLLGKKKYIGLKYEGSHLNKGKLDYKGIEMVRRDSSLLCRNTQAAFIEKLFQKGKKSAIEYLRNRVVQLMSGNLIDKEMFELSKKLTKLHYKTKTDPVHVQVYKQMVAENPMIANEVGVGDRISYYIAKSDKEKVSASALPIQKFDIRKVDLQYYLEKQINQPLERLLEPILSKKEIKELFESYKQDKRTWTNKRKLEKAAARRLFFGCNQTKKKTKV